MADLGDVGGIGGDILNKVMTGGVVVVGVIILAGIILAIGLYIRYLKQFNVKVEIKSLRGSGTRGEPIYKLVSDMGGFIHSKKDKSSWFRLRGEKVDLPTPPLETLQLDSHGKNHLKIFQKSDSEYYYLLPDKIDLNSIVRGNELIPIAQAGMKVVEGDVAYWGQLRKRDNRKLFDVESLFMKLLPYIVPVLMFMLVIFMTYMITDHWGEFSNAAQHLSEAAKALRDVSTASVTTG